MAPLEKFLSENHGADETHGALKNSFTSVNPKGCQKVAGGCSAAKTTGRFWDKSCTLKGCQNLFEEYKRLIPETSHHI